MTNELIAPEPPRPRCWCPATTGLSRPGPPLTDGPGRSLRRHWRATTSWRVTAARNVTGNAMSMSVSSLVAVELVFGSESKW